MKYIEHHMIIVMHLIWYKVTNAALYYIFIPVHGEFISISYNSLVTNDGLEKLINDILDLINDLESIIEQLEVVNKIGLTQLVHKSY